jgi:hypothetical protein
VSCPTNVGSPWDRSYAPDRIARPPEAATAHHHLKGFNGFSGSNADAGRLYHVNKASDGKEYALVAMHVISKLVPNWTWETFEHKDNPGRCDVLGCRDAFGAQQAVVAPLSATESEQHYGDCLKTSALMALIDKTKWDPAYVNYCLKGSQTDFTDATGLAIRVGNSVTENGFVRPGLVYDLSWSR